MEIEFYDVEDTRECLRVIRICDQDDEIIPRVGETIMPPGFDEDSNQIVGKVKKYFSAQ